MSLSKIWRSIKRYENLDVSLPSRKRIVVLISDSKGVRLKNASSYAIERDIYWLCEKGLTSNDGIEWFKEEYLHTA